MKNSPRLAVIETHPIQYHAPMYRVLEQEFGVSVTAIYGSDFSVAGYTDAEFGAEFRWDTDLLSGYTPHFLSTVAQGGGRSFDTVMTQGLTKTLHAVNPSGVMLVGYSPRFHRDAFFTAWRGGYPMLFRGETTDHAHSRNPLKQNARALALQWLYARCAALLYVGKRSHDHFRALDVPETRLFFSPYCVDATPFQLNEAARTELRAKTRAEFEISPEQIVLLFSGKLAPRKAPDLLIRAMQLLPEVARSHITLLMLGDGELRGTLAQLAEQEPRVQVCFAGFQNQAALSRFYHAADMLVLPSRADETWGLVVNEALEHGVPCIVSDRVGCAPDLVTPGATGEIFCADDVNGLAQAIQRVIAWSSGANTRAVCQERAEQYSTRHAAEGVVRALEEVLRP